MCDKNDNTADTRNPYCLPYVRSRMTSAGASCASRKNNTADCNDEACFLMMDPKKKFMVCSSVANKAVVPSMPIGDVRSLCENSCFMIVQYASAGIAQVAFDLVAAAAEGGADLTSTKGTIGANPVKQALDDMTAGFSARTMNQSGAFLDALAENMCVQSRTGRFCSQAILPLYNNPSGCLDSDVQMMMRGACPTTAACKTTITTSFSNAGCCARNWVEMVKSLDPSFRTIPNFERVATACGVRMPAECDPYSAEDTVEVKLSITCAWLQESSKNVDLVVSELASKMGVKEQAIRDGITFTDERTGGPCDLSKVSGNATASSGNKTARARLVGGRRQAGGSSVSLTTKGSSAASVDRKNEALKSSAGSDGLSLPQAQKASSASTARSDSTVTSAAAGAKKAGAGAALSALVAVVVALVAALM